jgi:retron-type reverse transcriptase
MHKNDSIIIKLNDKTRDCQNKNQGVWQGRPLSLTLFNVYLNEMIIHWDQLHSNGTEINDYTILNTLLFADDQVLLSDS